VERGTSIVRRRINQVTIECSRTVLRLGAGNLTGGPGDLAWSRCATIDILVTRLGDQLASSHGGREGFWKMKSLSQVPFDLATDPPARRDTPMPLSERVGITRDALTSLTEATRSGQHHLMRRVLDILQAEIIRPTVRVTQSQVVVVMAAVTELQHEAARSAPDIALFCARARLVIDILSSP